MKLFRAYLADKQAEEYYITGRAGTGKTTSLAKYVLLCDSLNISYVILAFTHKACNILRSKLPPQAKVVTLHSYLKKRPGLNEHATQLNHISVNSIARVAEGNVDTPEIVFIDEYSMVGERDRTDIVNLDTKIVWLGDPYQLPPVGDQQTVSPQGKYCEYLTKVHRTDRQDLLNVMTNLVSYIEKTSPPEAIPSSEHVIRGVDLVKQYKDSQSTDKVLLAWTNEKVQWLNQQIAGKEFPSNPDAVWNASTRQPLQFLYIVGRKEVTEIETPRGTVELGTKYKTLEHLKTLDDIVFAKVEDEEGAEYVIAMVFGHFNFKKTKEAYKMEAVSTNQAIKYKHEGSPAIWAKANSRTKLAKARGKAWRNLLTFDECVSCVDFPFAQTVHKSQGSTYKEVYIDTDDLARCGAKNFDLYLRLTYVAISRAGMIVYTN